MAKKQKLKIIPLGGLDEIGKNITVIKEFPRWIRRNDGVLHRHNVPCGYYDPMDGAAGTLRIGTPLENVDYSNKKYDGKESPLIAYFGEAMTWKQ